MVGRRVYSEERRRGRGGDEEERRRMSASGLSGLSGD